MRRSTTARKRGTTALLGACLALASSHVLAASGISGLSPVAYDKLKAEYDKFKVSDNTFAWRVFSGAGSVATSYGVPSGGVLYSIAYDDWVWRSDRGSFLYNYGGSGMLVGDTSVQVNARSAIGTNRANVFAKSTVVPVSLGGSWNSGPSVQGRFETSFTDVIRPASGAGGRFSLGAHADAVLPKYVAGQADYSFSFGWTIFGSNGVSKPGGGSLQGTWLNNGYIVKQQNCTNCNLTQSTMTDSGFVRSDFSFLMNLAPGDYVRVYSEITGSLNFFAAGRTESALLDAGSTARIDLIQSLDGVGLESASGTLAFQDGAWRYPTMPAVAVPEPASAALLLLGLAGVAGLRRQARTPI